MRVDWVGPGEKHLAGRQSASQVLQDVAIKLLSALLPVAQHGAGQKLSRCQHILAASGKGAIRPQMDGKLAAARHVEECIAKIPEGAGCQLPLDTIWAEAGHGG